MAKSEFRPDRPEAAQALLDFLNRPDYEPLPQRELLHRMQVRSEDRPKVRRLIRRLLDDSKIVRIGGGRLVAPRGDDVVHGRLQRHRDGFGFVVPEDGSEDLFIPPHLLGDEALTGDRVEARISRRRREGRLHGALVRVLESRGREVLGLFTRRGKGGFVRPFDPARGESIHIAESLRHGAEDDDAVRIEISRAPAAGRDAEGRVLEVVGRLADAGTDVAVVIRKYSLDPEFPADVLEAAALLPQRIPAKPMEGRERFDDPEPVTIDGETAQDFDDAVAVARLPRGGYRLWVHIADVAHFVPEGSVLDDEARRRGTSVYFPGRVLPMFPEALSNGLCSLRPDEDRLVQSAILDFDDEGHVTGVRFADGVIRSAARLTYTQVSAALEGQAGTTVPARLLPMLRDADRLRELLERRRHARGSVDFDLPEPQILLDVEGVMTGITVEPRNTAHRLIEEFMLAANEAVARRLEDGGVATLYRVHEAPDPLKLETLVRFVEGYGLRVQKQEGPPRPEMIQRMLESVEGRPESRVISQVALRSMKQARYSADNVGHFGLASATYCHFTSPIRRYPDLVVHRELRALRNGTARAADTARDALEALGLSCSERERNAEAAERELLVWKKVAFIADKVGQEFDGIVTGVARFGLFVQLIENLVEGLVRVESLGDDWYEFDETRFELLGQRSGQRFRLGDMLSVRVDKVDQVLQRVDLAPVLPQKAATRRARKKKP